MRRRFSYAVSLVAAALCVVVAGCAGEEEPPGPPTPNSTPTTPSPGESSSGSGSPAPSKSGAVVAPKVPVVAQERTESGAKAFLQFFFDEFNRGTTAPGTVDLFAISDPGCRACRNAQEDLQAYVDQGLHLREASLRVTHSELFEIRSSGVATADKVRLNFTLEQRPLPTYQGEEYVGDLSPYTQTRRAAIRWVDGAWEMFDVEDPNA